MKDEMGRTYRTHETRARRLSFNRKPPLATMYVWNVVQMYLSKTVCSYILDSVGLTWRPVAGSPQHGNKSQGSINADNFFAR
jgi:hypothetical protein